VNDAGFEHTRREGPDWLADKRALLISLNRLLLLMATVELAVIFMLGGAVLALANFQQLVPLVLSINADHSYQLVRDLRELAPSKQQELIQGTVGTYVQNREEYYLEGAPRSYMIISTMSDKKVRDEYQQWFAAPKSPQQRLWDRGHIVVELIPGTIEITSGEIPLAIVPFWLTEQLYGETAGTRRHYTARIAFRLIDQVTSSEFGFNPAGLRVTSYRLDCDTKCGEPSS
jgi:type IV secretory pathway component VirB8